MTFDDLILHQRIHSQEEFVTSEKELMALIVNQLAENSSGAEERPGLITTDQSVTVTSTGETDVHPGTRSRADSFASTITADSESTEAVTMIQENHLFDRDHAQMLEGDMYVYADARPLAESMMINCAGTFTLYLNAENKIEKYVFLYSAMETSTSQG